MAGDSSLAELVTLPAGRVAWRDRTTDPWTIEDFAYPDESEADQAAG
ncbi:hypothetical protein ACFWUP_27280 [Nocardia sp. NPDC058658]